MKIDNPKEIQEWNLPDDSDRNFYEIALETKEADTKLVTGNIRHFPKVDFVMTPRDFVEFVDESITISKKK